jgi:CRISPR-associated protein Cas2
MAHGSQLYLVGYDIPHDGRRARVAKLLLGYGERVQESVFECFLDIAGRRELEKRLRAVLKPAEDNLRIYGLCETCRHGVRTVGGLPPERRTVYVV